MPNKLVDIFDQSGAKLFTYSIALEEDDCINAEFEEVALILAEASGLVHRKEIAQLRATCEFSALALKTDAATSLPPVRSKSRKGAVVSLVKHRMKRADAQSAERRVRQVS